jgi:hypothetical protein
MAAKKRHPTGSARRPTAKEPRVESFLIIARFTALVIEVLRDWFYGGGLGRPR